jgi:DNA repair/transcription protein MET18/MMS19
MSALQTFMLVVDHDKAEAKQIAERVAQGIVSPLPQINTLGY